jgi:tripartite-type tricarboxylate transporter receptor subunit TctC
MKLPRRQFLRLATGAAALPVMSRMASAQAYPTRPVHLIVGLAAGGPTDVSARIIAEALSQHFGQQFVVENRTGMGGNLANNAVVRSPADGYTLLFGGPTGLIGAAIYKNLPFNFLQDTAPVGSVLRFPNLMLVPPSLPVKTVQEFIDYAKANPRKLSMASSGVGASTHLSGELFKFMTKIDMVHVPYRGSSAVYPDLMSGKVDVFFDNLAGQTLNTVQTGRLRALGVTSANRWATIPDVPAISETVPGYEVVLWYGIHAPKNTSPQIVAALNKGINAALADTKVKTRFAQDGGELMSMTPEDFGKFLADDAVKWRKVVEFAGISID